MLSNSVLEQSRTYFEKILSQIFEDGKIAQLDGISQIIEWYKESKTDKGVDVVKLSNKIANKVVDYWIEPLFRPVLSDIEIEIQKKESKITFNTNPYMSELKPYVEFVKKLNNTDIAAIKIKFKIKTEIQLNDIQIACDGKDSKVDLGTLSGKLSVYISEIKGPAISSDKEHLIGESEISLCLPTVFLTKTRVTNHMNNG